MTDHPADTSTSDSAAKPPTEALSDGLSRGAEDKTVQRGLDMMVARRCREGSDDEEVNVVVLR